MILEARAFGSFGRDRKRRESNADGVPSSNGRPGACARLRYADLSCRQDHQPELVHLADPLLSDRSIAVPCCCSCEVVPG